MKKKLVSKIWIRVDLDRSLGYLLVGDIKKAAKTLEQLDKDYQVKGFRNLVLDMDYWSDYDGDHVALVLYGERLETDKEYQKRLKSIEDNDLRIKGEKLAKEAKDRAEYERLKKKFG